MALTNKRYIQFIEHYMSNGMNGTQAYLSTYPNASIRTANENSFKILNKTEIKARIQELQAETSQTLQVTKESLINDLIKIKNLCMDDPRAVHNSTKAIEVIAKMLGLNEPDSTINLTTIQTLDINKLIGFEDNEEDDDSRILLK